MVRDPKEISAGIQSLVLPIGVIIGGVFECV